MVSLNTLSPAPGAKKARRRVGRGIGSGLGKTCGRGHKGQKSRTGNNGLIGFEGGQMPLQRRLPKSGFTSMQSLTRDEIRLHELNKIKSGTVVDMTVLKAHGLINNSIKEVKIIAKGKIEHALTIKGIPVTKGAKAAIEALGGKVE